MVAGREAGLCFTESTEVDTEGTELRGRAVLSSRLAGQAMNTEVARRAQRGEASVVVP